jgi:hypothetical protein
MQPTNGLRRCAAPAAFGLVLGLAAGCTTWVKPGADPAMLDAAETHCRAAAYSALPPNMVTTHSNGADYAELGKCEKNNAGATCKKINGRYTAVNKVTNDVNENGRDAVFRSCMLSGGWSEQ